MQYVKRQVAKALHASTWVKALVAVGAIVVVSGAVATAAVLHKPAKPHPAHTVTYAKTTGNQPTQSDTTSTLDVPAASTATATTSPAATYTPAPPNNTAKCNQLVASDEATLSSLYSQENQQMALAKQIIENSGSSVYQETNGSGVTGMVNQGETSESAQQAENNASNLSTQILSDRNGYYAQLLGLNCYKQAGTILDYQPS